LGFNASEVTKSRYALGFNGFEACRSARRAADLPTRQSRPARLDIACTCTKIPRARETLQSKPFAPDGADGISIYLTLNDVRLSFLAVGCRLTAEAADRWRRKDCDISTEVEHWMRVTELSEAVRIPATSVWRSESGRR
jgi:hypothetical protein